MQCFLTRSCGKLSFSMPPKKESNFIGMSHHAVLFIHNNNKRKTDVCIYSYHLNHSADEQKRQVVLSQRTSFSSTLDGGATSVSIYKGIIMSISTICLIILPVTSMSWQSFNALCNLTCIGIVSMPFCWTIRAYMTCTLYAVFFCVPYYM